MKELVVSLLLLVLVLLLVNPLPFFMPDPMLKALIAGLVVAFGLYASFILGEQAHDEREQLHRMFAGRIAFLAGASVLVVGIVVQALRHDVDRWLVLTLAAMILGKLAGLRYGRKNQ